MYLILSNSNLHLNNSTHIQFLANLQ